MKRLFAIRSRSTGHILRGEEKRIIYLESKMVAKDIRDEANASLPHPDYYVSPGPDHKRAGR